MEKIKYREKLANNNFNLHQAFMTPHNITVMEEEEKVPDTPATTIVLARCGGKKKLPPKKRKVTT